MGGKESQTVAAIEDLFRGWPSILPSNRDSLFSSETVFAPPARPRHNTRERPDRVSHPLASLGHTPGARTKALKGPTRTRTNPTQGRGEILSRDNSEAAPLIDTCTRRGQRSREDITDGRDDDGFRRVHRRQVHPPRGHEVRQGPRRRAACPRPPPRGDGGQPRSPRQDPSARRAPAWSARRPRAGTPTPTPRTRIPTP